MREAILTTIQIGAVIVGVTCCTSDDEDATGGDGDTDTADLLALLGAWGECP